MRTWMMMGLLLLAISASAGVPDAPPKVESSMMLAGEISVDAGGNVVGYTLDQANDIPSGVTAFLRDRIPHWQFRPMFENNQPVGARNRMRLLLVAMQMEGGGYEMRLQAASFDPLSNEEGYDLTALKMLRPKYPREMARAGVEGTVFLLAKVGRDGAVQSSFVEQVNLHAWGSEAVMQKMRESFSEPARDVARRWRFKPPTQGELARDAYWIVRVPIRYAIRLEPHYGRWIGYVPGPRSMPEWVDRTLLRASPEALPEGTASLLADDGLHLLTPLGEGS